MKAHLCAALLLAVALPVAAQLGSTCTPAIQPSDFPSVFNILTQAEGDTIELRADMDTLMALRRSRRYTPAVIRTKAGFEVPLELRSRGKFRRKKNEVPPLKLKFSKKTIQKEQMDTLNEIKLVLPMAFNATGEELLMREYIAYRMYEKLTPYSFRARLVNLRLMDTKGKPPRYCLAFLVEHEEEVAARLRKTIIETWAPPADSICQEQTALAIIYEYLIGNTDWDMSSSRNMLFMRGVPTDRMLVVPYDFDFSGFVGAPYASPNSDTGLKNVLDRALMPKNVDPVALRNALKIVKNAKANLLAECKAHGASKKSVSKMTAYLEVFFKAVETQTDPPPFIPLEQH
jgi:hypothetical protein